MKTASSAHVCTPGHVPPWHSAHDPATALSQETGERRFWVVHAETPPANWPGQLPVLLPPVERTHDSLARYHDYPPLAGSLHCKSFCGTVHFAARRHYPETGKWDCTEYRLDEQGREWARVFYAVTDDHGWLVEVPTC